MKLKTTFLIYALCRSIKKEIEDIPEIDKIIDKLLSDTLSI